MLFHVLLFLSVSLLHLLSFLLVALLHLLPLRLIVVLLFGLLMFLFLLLLELLVFLLLTLVELLALLLVLLVALSVAGIHGLGRLVSLKIVGMDGSAAGVTGDASRRIVMGGGGGLSYAFIEGAGFGGCSNGRPTVIIAGA